MPKVRAGLGDVADVSVVEAFTDEEFRRATGLDVIVAPGGAADPARAPALAPELARDVLRALHRLRALDAEAQALAQAGRIGALPSTRGREAAIVGAAAALGADDVIAPGRREAAVALWRGMDLRALAAQLYGNANDVAAGRQLPGCVTAPRALGVLPATPHAGTQLAHAAGVAWAMKMQRKSTIVLATLDAAETSSEDFHTGINFAGVYKLPAIFVCVTSVADGANRVETASQTFAVKALAYGVAGVRVDGDDAVVVLSATAVAAQRARRGQGPTLIEAVVTRGDGIDRFTAWLAREGTIDAATAGQLCDEAAQEVKAALAAERAVGAPSRRRLIEDVWSRPTSALEADLETLERVRNR